MDYRKLADLIPREKRRNAAIKLVSIILSSKNDDKMPGDLANLILRQWQQNLLVSISGLSALLNAAVLLEQEKALTFLKESQLNEIVDKIKGET